MNAQLQMIPQLQSEPIQPQPNIRRWSPALRISFRFWLVYLGLYCLSTQIIGNLFTAFGRSDLATLWPLRPVIFWTAAHIFHVEVPLSYDINSGTSDGIGVSSIMIPLQVGIDVDLKIIGAEVGIGPTLTFNTSVGDNAFGLEEGDLNGTRVGGLLSAKVHVAFLGGFVGYQVDVTDAFKGVGSGGFNQWMFGLGVNF